MRFRLTSRSITLGDLELLVLIIVEFRGISRIWEATTAQLTNEYTV